MRCCRAPSKLLPRQNSRASRLRRMRFLPAGLAPLALLYTSEPSRPPVPLQSPGDPLIQIYARLPAEHSPRLVDAERAILEVEVEAPAVERRLDTEGPAKGLAKSGRGIEGASGPMEPGRRNTRLLGDERD